MSGSAAVCVDDNFPASQAGVTVGSPGNEVATGVNEVPGRRAIKVHELQHGGDDVLFDIVGDLFERNPGVVLGGNNDGIHLDRHAIVIPNSDLGLSIRAQVIH